MSGGCRGRGEQEVASFSACFFCPVVCSPGIWWGIFPGNILYVKAPTFLHLGSVGAFSLPFWEYLNRISRWCQAIWPVVCPLPEHGRKCFAGKLFSCRQRTKAVSRQFGQAVSWGGCREKIWRFAAHTRVRLDQVQFRPGFLEHVLPMLLQGGIGEHGFDIADIGHPDHGGTAEFGIVRG